MQQSSDMPKPADIIAIIDPQAREKKWCATTFIDIKRRKREGQFITDEEEKYCDNFINSKVHEVDYALGEVKRQNKQYWIGSDV